MREAGGGQSFLFNYQAFLPGKLPVGSDSIGSENGRSNTASREFDALAFNLSRGDRTSGPVTGGVVRAHGFRAGIGIATYPDVIGNLQAPSELMGGAVRYDLNPLAFDSVAIRDPYAFAVTIAAMRVTGIRVRLLHGAVTIEDVHVVRKRRVGIFNNPRPNNGVRKAASIRQTAATVKYKCDGGQESGPKQWAPFIHMRSTPIDALNWRPNPTLKNFKRASH
jgi:hypothetical protein